MVLQVAEAAGVMTVTLDRPAVLNALNSEMRAGLTAALRRAAAGDLRAVVLTGAGRAFCAGQDLGDGAGLVPSDVSRILAEEYEPMLAAIVDCPCPVIAAVNGVAAGAGANLALVCDLVIAAESATFVQAFTRIGLMPDAGGTWVLPRLVGMQRAMGAMLFAEPVAARQAAEWGMIWEAVPDAAFQARVAARAAALAAGPGRAQREIKAALRAAVTNDLAAQLAVEAAGQGRCAAAPDFAEGLAAFAARRPPRFTGR
jgi:2-(1,2-epoxy-1,2-dihydrophenyl)acetyl-CoA isomerase